MKDPKELTWYIFPFNILDFEIIGADPQDINKTLEDGGEFYIKSAKAYAVLLRYNKNRNKLSGPKFIENGVYTDYLEPDRYHGYTWEEIKKITIDIMFSCQKDGYKVEKHYKTRK